MMRALIRLAGALCLVWFVFAVPQRSAEAAPCSADWTELGFSDEGTQWFNVFGIGFHASEPVVLKFSEPVISYPVEGVAVPPTAVTTFTMPTAYMSSYFKWTLRPEDVAVTRIKVNITGPRCEASTTVRLRLPDTAVDSAPPAGAPTSPVILIALTAAALGGLFIARRCLPDGQATGISVEDAAPPT